MRTVLEVRCRQHDVLESVRVLTILFRFPCLFAATTPTCLDHLHRRRPVIRQVCISWRSASLCASNSESSRTSSGSGRQPSGEWDVQQAEISAIKQMIFSVTAVDGELMRVDPGQLLSDRIPEPVSATVCPREFRCTGILPAALYRLLQISSKADWSLRESRLAVPAADDD